MWKRDSKEESIGTNRGKGLLSSISYAHLDFESRWLDGTRLNAKGMKQGLQDSSFSLFPTPKSDPVSLSVQILCILVCKAQ